jgi:hypothetical protein
MYHLFIFRNHTLSERQGAWKILGRMTTNPLIQAQAPKPLSGQVQLRMALQFFPMYRDTRRILATLRTCLLLNPLDPLRCTLNVILSKPAIRTAIYPIPYVFKGYFVTLLLRFTYHQ